MNYERLGLVLIAASLAAILAVAALLAKFHRESQLEEVRREGIAMARLVSKIPYERFGPGYGPQSPLQILSTQGTPGFAYAVVVDPSGAPLAEVTMPGVVVPAASLPPEPASWLGEREVSLPGRSRPIHEFVAPIFLEGERVAHVRIGFRDPGYGPLLREASLIGMLALPIFLLAPLSYFAIRREVRPLVDASQRIRELVESDDVKPVKVDASGQLGEFLVSFNRFAELAQSRVRELRAQQTGILTSSKVLSYQKARIESVLESLPDPTLVLDPAGTIVFANAKFEGLMGASLDAVVGRRPEEWCTHEELLAFLARDHGASTRRLRTATLEFAPDGSDQRVVASAHPLIPAGEEPGGSGTVMVFRDVTAEVLQRRVQAEFVTHVAHELKSPLNVFSTYSEFLLGKEGESEEFRIEACNVIQEQVQRLTTLIDTLMNIARIESGAVRLQRQRVRLPEFLRDIVENLSRGGKLAGVRVELDLPAESRPVFVDKGLLRVALNNLLTNAIKYNRDGGTVTVGVDEDPDYLVLRVSDTGIGISEEERTRIFGKFYRSERSEVQLRPGHGLGLALCKEIVELHGGEIRVESVPDEGSTFSLAFRKTSALIREASGT